MKKLKAYATPGLRITRAERDMSQAEIVDYIALMSGIHMSPDNYSKIERGERNIEVDKAWKIARVLGTSAKELWVTNDPSIKIGVE